MREPAGKRAAAQAKARALVLGSLPATQNEISLRLGMAQSSVSRWLGLLFESGEAHIGRWQRTRAKFEGVWVAGGGQHVACDLLPLKVDKRSPSWRAEAEKDPMDRDAADRARRLAEIKVRRDPMDEAFFGPGPGGAAPC